MEGNPRATKNRKENEEMKANEVVELPFSISNLPLPIPDFEHMRGPTDYTFWVIKNRLLAGAIPKTSFLVSAMLKSGNFLFSPTNC